MSYTEIKQKTAIKFFNELIELPLTKWKPESAIPTLHEVQDWFRDEHNLDIEPEKYRHDFKNKRMYKCRIWGFKMENEGYVTGFSSYYEALEEGISEAIRILKEKQEEKNNRARAK